MFQGVLQKDMARFQRGCFETSFNPHKYSERGEGVVYNTDLWFLGYFVNCVLCTVYCVFCTVYFVLYTVYCVLCTVYRIWFTVYCVLYTVYCVLCIVYCVLYTE